MDEFCNLVGTDVAPVSKKAAVKVQCACFGKGWGHRVGFHLSQMVASQFFLWSMVAS